MKYMDMEVCQVCEKKLPDAYLDNNLNKELFKEAPTWAFNPKNLNCCSYECHLIAIQARGAFTLRERVRNMVNMPFDSFNEIFKFPVKGGYAEDMYNKMRTNTWLFLLKLDNGNFVKIITKGIK